MLRVIISKTVNQKYKNIFISFLIIAQAGICKYSDPYSYSVVMTYKCSKANKSFYKNNFGHSLKKYLTC